MKIDFYYWSYQCPLNNTMIELLKEYEDKLDIIYHDISKDFILAQKMNMFFPTLTIVNDKHRYFAPVRRKFLNSLCNGEIPIERPYIPKLGITKKNVILEPIRKSNYSIAGKCTGGECSKSCNKKIKFLEDKDISILGYMNVDENNKLLGGVEYMPSLLIPYKIPKDDKTAFLTCVYISDSDFDYKSGPLTKLEDTLVLKYNKILVISDEKGIFPNGDLDFFIKNGYEDMGVISEEDNYCRLHLLCKYIK
ncbi:hypothetical protein [Clostridium ihumii]|uniref:hypothetical protein n=1 Tax=Clostridium ihumii TaxID=1470356 RepID=UPI003D354E4A